MYSMSEAVETAIDFKCIHCPGQVVHMDHNICLYFDDCQVDGTFAECTVSLSTLAVRYVQTTTAGYYRA